MSEEAGYRHRDEVATDCFARRLQFALRIENEKGIGDQRRPEGNQKQEKPAEIGVTERLTARQ